MKRKIIAVDVDDVLAVENDAVRQFANERYGHKHTPDDYVTRGAYWSYWESVQGVDKQEGARRYGEYLASGLKGRLEVMPGAVDALRSLQRRYDLIIVTSREAHLLDITKQWLEAHFPDVFKEVAFVAIWSGSVKGSKADICKKLGADYLIDDNPSHLELAVGAGIKGILFGTYGWSLDVPEDAPYVRVHNWAEVEAYFDQK